MLKAYTDGSALNNGLAGNIGGFGYVIVDEHDHIIDAFSSPRIKNTTNNAQELLAIWAVLKKYPDEELSIYSDSYYALNSICTWMYNWAKNDWKNTASRRIENYDIITTIYKFMTTKKPKVEFYKIKGHQGEKYNELADKLATGEIKPESILWEGDISSGEKEEYI